MSICDFSSSSISVNRNTTITIKVTPNANYKLSKLLVNNVNIYDSGNTSNTYTFTVKEDTSISVTFEEDICLVYFSDIAHGTITVNGSSTSPISVNRNTTITINVDLMFLYKVRQILANSTVIWSGNQSEVTVTYKVTENTTISVIQE